MLGKEKYEVVSLDNPLRVSEQLTKTGARVVLLDIDMPEVDGLTLLKQIKMLDGGVQVIMLTGLVSLSTVLQSMRWGAEACIFKPLTDFDPLLTVVKTTFDKIDRWWQALGNLQKLRTHE